MAKKPALKAKVKVARKPSAKKLAADSAAEAEKETKRHMNELMQAATEFFKAGTAFFLLNTGKTATVAAPAAEPVKEEAAEPAAKRGRRTKEQIAADNAAAATAAPAEDPLAGLGLPPETAPAVPAPKPLTDKESYDLLLKTAGEYVAHFTKEKGIPKAKAHLAPYKVEKITDLKHEQRLPYIKTLADELAAAK